MTAGGRGERPQVLSLYKFINTWTDEGDFAIGQLGRAGPHRDSLPYFLTSKLLMPRGFAV